MSENLTVTAEVTATPTPTPAAPDQLPADKPAAPDQLPADKPAAPDQLPAKGPTIFAPDGKTILSKRDALKLPANAGISRRDVERAIVAEWRKCAKAAAAIVGTLAHDYAAAGGAVIYGPASKSGNRTIRLVAPEKAKKESAKAKIARLEAELAALRAPKA